jgi:hypothetical protein
MDGAVVSVATNTPTYRDALIRYIATFRVSVREAIRFEAAQLGQRVISFTPPRNQAQGRNRVMKDIHKIMLGLSDADFAKANPDHTDKAKFDNIVRLFPARDGSILGVDKDLYRPGATMEDLYEFHQSKRLKNGRVSDAAQQTVDVGRWRFLEKLIVPKNLLDEYISRAMDRVGRARGGWAAGTLKLGGKVAKWIAAHANKGTYINELDNRNPSFEFINRSEWASAGDQDRIMENAVTSRTKDINAHIKRAIRESGKGLFA